jgi:hypothetical protein
LEALRTEGLAKFYGNTSVTTLSGRPAYLVNGGEVPVLTSSGTGAPSVAYKQFGTVVNFLPIVLGDGKIYLEVRPEVSAKNDANGLFIAGVTPTAIPGFDTRSAQVTVTMEDGQTMAIGGLIQNNIDATANKVPVLGDLPFFGTAFRSVSYRESEEELLILVTPRLVDPMACCQLPKYLPGQETRSPDDFELFLEGILEAPRGQRTVYWGLNYTAAHTTGPTAGHYPCGDYGCGGGPFGRCEGDQAMSCNRRNSCRSGNCNLAGCNSCNSNGFGANGYGPNGNNGYNGSPTLGRAMPYPSMVNPGIAVEPMPPTPNPATNLGTPNGLTLPPNPMSPNPAAPLLSPPSQPRELPFSSPPALPGGQLPALPGQTGGGLPSIPRIGPGPQGAVGNMPVSQVSLGPVIQ